MARTPWALVLLGLAACSSTAHVEDHRRLGEVARGHPASTPSPGGSAQALRARLDEGSLEEEGAPDPADLRHALAAQGEADVEALVSLALARNPRIRARVKALEAAMEEIPQAGAAPVPSVGLRLTLPTADFLGRVVEQMLAISQTAVLRSRLDARALAAAERAWEVAEDLQEEMLALRLEVVTAAAALQRLDETAGALRENADQARQLVGLVRAMLEVGREGQQGAVRTELRLSQLEARLLELARERREQEAALLELLGATEAMPVGQVALAEEPAEEPDLKAEVERALARRPALAASRHRLRAQVAGLRLAELGAWPDPMLTLDHMHQRPMREGMLRPQAAIELPFLTPGRRRAEVEQARALLGMGIQEHRAEQARVAAEVATAHARLAEASRSLRLFDEQLRPQAEAAWQAAMAGYQTGRVDYTAVLEALIARNDVEVEHRAAAFRHRVALEALRRAAGGAEEPHEQPPENLP